MPHATPLKGGSHRPAPEDAADFRQHRLKFSDRRGRPTLAAACSAAFLSATALGGCASAPPSEAAAVPAVEPCPPGQALSPATLTVTATATSAEVAPGLTPAVRPLFEDAGRRDDGCVLVIAPDGTATTYSLTPRRRGGAIERGHQREALRQRTLAGIEDRLARMAAARPGLDTRAAIMAAVQAHPQPGVLVVISSGVSTRSPIDLRSLGWEADAEALGTFLAREHWLDGLAGWDVRFGGIGDTAGQQEPLPDPARHRLEQFWIGICRAAGAARCTSAGHPDRKGEPASHNEVPPVPPPAQREFTTAVTVPTRTAFSKDSAVLALSTDPLLRTLVDRVIAQDLVLRITGYTDASTGNPAHNLDLSRRRAEAVRQRLVQLGLPVERIVAVEGVGSADFSRDDEERDRALVEQHRKVEIGLAKRPATP